MVEALLLASWVGTALFFICREIKANDDRKSHERWISELRECLHSIENEFSRRCLDIVKKSRHNYSSKYLLQVSELRKEYINEVYNKVAAQKGEKFATILPDYILREYDRNISEIAEIYRYIFFINE